MDEFHDLIPGTAYSPDQIRAWLQHIRLPQTLTPYINNPSSIPKTYSTLQQLMRCQITRFPYENLSVHYSPTHSVTIRPEALYQKFMGPYRDGGNGRGGYCMELSIFFHHMLRGLGFYVYMTAVRIRSRVDGVPQGDFGGYTHINNIVHLSGTGTGTTNGDSCSSSSSQKFSVDVAFGGDGPTNPMPLVEQHEQHEQQPSRHAPIIPNLGPQEVRLLQSAFPKQSLKAPRHWIYQYRNGADKPWNSFYCFTENEFFQEDFEVMNWFTSTAISTHRLAVLVVRFLRRDEKLRFEEGSELPEEEEVEIVGKVMLVNNVVKVNWGGKTTVVHSCDSEEQRVQALREYFGIYLTGEEARAIQGWDMELKS
ncbi:N-terminal acetyltransferase [Aspergillus nanangensis]|uniref:N-terminal acetyltransferase n=1 Tax=Aspergillus nanangensis TaxID=2582783 RepID=A0AAD4CKT2_ASPNN|nr:N-terminal acetyltransferase [Aspergillus nanangensis]